MNLRAWCAAALLWMLPIFALAQPPYQIGTYYFPGWSEGSRGAQFAKPWDRIRPFPEREPLIGWYNDSDPATLRRQADQMKAAGLAFVAFDWYWDQQGAFMEHALLAYQKIHRAGDPGFVLMWANHYRWTGGSAAFERMVDHWLDHHLGREGYYRFDGRPVIFIFSVEDFARNAAEMEVPPAQLVAIIRSKARARGLPGVYLVGGAPALQHWARNVAPAAGFDAISAYNYHFGFSGTSESRSERPHSYASLDANYRQNWTWLLTHGSLPYVVPMTAGWDKRPWLSADESGTHRSIATPAEFEAHLRAAKQLMQQHPMKASQLAVVCCWNEFGEGSFIEPTKSRGTAVLDRIKDVFGGD